MIFLIIILTMIFLVITFDIFLLVTILHQLELASKAMARDSSWSPEVEPPGAVRGAVVGARWWGRGGGGSDSGGQEGLSQPWRPCHRWVDS